MPGDTSAVSSAISVASLVQRNVALEWHEVIAITLEVADELERSGKNLLPTYHYLELTADGTVRFLRPPNRPADPVATLVDIFRALLPTDAPEHVWTLVSGTGPDSPVYESVSDFAAAIRAFERPGRPEILSAVYRRALETPVPSGQVVAPEGSGQTLPVEVLRIDDILDSGPPADAAISESLAAVVRNRGVLQPPLVRRRQSGYELVAGAVWLAAAKAAELKTLPCRVCDLDDQEAQVLVRLDREVSRDDPEEAESHRGPDLATVLDPTLGELTGSLVAAMSSWGLSTESVGRPYHRTVSDVTRVELQRGDLARGRPSCPQRTPGAEPEQSEFGHVARPGLPGDSTQASPGEHPIACEPRGCVNCPERRRSSLGNGVRGNAPSDPGTRW